MHILRALYRDETGATGIEYGLIASLIAMALVSGFDSLGNEVGTSFGDINDKYAAIQ
ncbi:Flp family type IVb pilin [Aurantiacibacter poecillastricola]|uniref:Flp family type IVb pilin n=1 Tax=Aurantiacibacter poecillastricola TaxID=3064385 RepID=UPI00273EC09B|nr:Flp family type IVb pilin [Aurantiacibacter sp. 219JJ12-13]MDP5261805.1 Flp family type IVb pilin [Aurantiacibacter sp. 219JJ12-13]